MNNFALRNSVTCRRGGDCAYRVPQLSDFHQAGHSIFTFSSHIWAQVYADRRTQAGWVPAVTDGTLPQPPHDSDKTDKKLSCRREVARLRLSVVSFNSTIPRVHYKSFIKPQLATARVASCIGDVHLFVCLSVCRQNAKNAIFSNTKQFRAMVSIDNL